MANTKIFGTGSALPKATDTKNEAGGRAYSLSDEEALAQLAMTGTFPDKTFYGTGADQLTKVKEVAARLDANFIAKTALYAREQGGMKDMSAALCVMLSKVSMPLLDRIFERVINNGKMLRNFVQMTLSGAFDRKCLGSGPKRLVGRWLNKKPIHVVVNGKIGTSPSLSAVIKLAHPKPVDDERRALFAWIRDREHNVEHLPPLVQQIEAFRAGLTTEVPRADFRFFDGVQLSAAQWTAVARGGKIIQLIKNLNSYSKHGVFDDKGVVREIAARIKDKDAIQKSGIWPTQVMAAWGAATEIPHQVRDALQDAMEAATENIPEFGTRTIVIVDVSGSMRCSLTGQRKGATSKIVCVQAAALIAATVLRRNPDTLVIPVDTRVHTANFNDRDAILSIAERLARYGGGGTSLSAALAHANRQEERAGLVLMLSDNESWFDGSQRHGYWSDTTATTEEWKMFKKRNRGAKMVCVDLQPYTTTQAPTDKDVMNIGGFTDKIFSAIGAFVAGANADGPGVASWVDAIKATEL